MNKPHETGKSREELEAELEAMRRRLAFCESVLEDLPVPVFVKDEDSRFCLFNRAYETFFGARREEMLGRTVLDLEFLSPEDRERYQAEDTARIGAVNEKHYHTSFQSPRGPRQALYWSKGIVAAGTGQVGRMGIIVDITKEWRLKRKLAQKVAELQRVKRILQEMSRTDALTGLSNRRPFDEFLEKCVAMAHRRGYPSCLLMLDLDHFKRINDTFGHGEGDTVLRACADTLREVSRREDLPARIGGEEFAVLLPSTELAEARVMAERIRCAIQERIILPDGQRVTASLGAAQYHIEESVEDFVRRTDEALYRAKHSGRNQVCS